MKNQKYKKNNNKKKTRTSLLYISCGETPAIYLFIFIK